MSERLYKPGDKVDPSAFGTDGQEATLTRKTAKDHDWEAQVLVSYYETRTGDERFFEPVDSLQLQKGDRVTSTHPDGCGVVLRVSGSRDVAEVESEIDEAPRWFALSLLSKVEPEEIDDEADDNLARRFHEAYERLAPFYSYETRKESAVPWEDVPANNKSLMRAVAHEILASEILPEGVRRDEYERLNDSQPEKTLRERAAEIPGIGLHGKLYAAFDRDSAAAQLAGEVVREHFNSKRVEIAALVAVYGHRNSTMSLEQFFEKYDAILFGDNQ